MSMTKSGPIARSTADTAIAYAAMAARDEDKQTSFHSKLYDGGVRGVPPAHFQSVSPDGIRDLSDVRIGVYPEWFYDADSDITDACMNAIRELQRRGAILVNITIPHMRWLSLAHGIKISAEYALEWDLIRHTRSADLEPNTRIFLSVSSTLSALEVLSADKLRAWTMNYTFSLFKAERLAAIVTPTVGILAAELHESYLDYGVSNTDLVMKVMKHLFFGKNSSTVCNMFLIVCGHI